MNNIKQSLWLFVIPFMFTLSTPTHALFKKKTSKKYQIQNKPKEKSHKKNAELGNAKPEKIIAIDFSGNLRTEYYEEKSKIEKIVTNILTRKIMVYYRDGTVAPFK